MVQSKIINWTEYLASVGLTSFLLLRSSEGRNVQRWIFLTILAAAYLLTFRLKKRNIGPLSECTLTHLVFWTTLCLFMTDAYTYTSASTEALQRLGEFLSGLSDMRFLFFVAVTSVLTVVGNKRFKVSVAFQVVRYTITFLSFYVCFGGQFFSTLVIATTICLTWGICEQFYLKRSLYWGSYLLILYLVLYNYIVGGEGMAAFIDLVDIRLLIVMFFVLGALQFLQKSEIYVSDGKDKGHMEQLLSYADSGISYEQIYGGAFLMAGLLFSVVTIWDKFYNIYILLFGVPVALIVGFFVVKWSEGYVSIIVLYGIAALMLMLAFSRTLQDNGRACLVFFAAVLTGVLILYSNRQKLLQDEDAASFFIAGFIGLAVLAMHFVMTTTDVTLTTFVLHRQSLLVHLGAAVLYAVLMRRTAQMSGVKYTIHFMREDEYDTPAGILILTIILFALVTVLQEMIR